MSDLDPFNLLALLVVYALLLLAFMYGLAQIDLMNYPLWFVICFYLAGWGLAFLGWRFLRWIWIQMEEQV